MDNKIFTTVLLVIIIVLVGMGIMSKQNSGAGLQQLMDQQAAILQGQNRLEAKLDDSDNSQLNAVLARVNTLEARLKVLEAKVNAAPTAAAPTQRAQPPRPDPNTVHEIPVAHTPIIGSESAKVTIVEFVDFECPFCARFHPPILQALEAYPNDVRYLVKNFPLNFHPNAKPAAKAALAAAEQGQYEAMVNKLIANGRNLNDEFYRKTAQELGLDMEKFESDLKNNDAKYEQMIQQDMQLGAKIGVRGTPTFFLNGKNTSARTFDAFKAEIDAILKK